MHARRLFALLATSCLTLAACGDDGSADTSSSTTGDSTSAGPTSTSTTTASSTITASTTDTTGSSTSATTTGDDTTTSVDTTGDDTTTGEDSTTGDTTGTTTGAMQCDDGDTIYDVQDGTIGTGQPTTINCVLVTAVGTAGFYAQEPNGGEFSGVWVFSGDMGPDISGLAVGDEVSFSGDTDEFFERTEINIATGTLDVVSTGNQPPDPVVGDPATLSDPQAAEPWESVLVRVDNDTFTVTAISQFDEVTTEDGNGNPVIIDDFLYNLPMNIGDLGVGATFGGITGPLNFSFDEYKIAPRDMNDLDNYVAP